MTDDVLYTGEWNELTRRPVAGFDWVNANDAAKLYESWDGLDIVDGAQIDSDGTPRPQWVIGAGSSGRIRVSYFSTTNSIWRQVDWDWVDGRLWRWITVDYTYADESGQREPDEAVLKVETAVRPDGTGNIIVLDKLQPSSANRGLTEFTGQARAAYWLDRPEFGDWTALADPGPSAYEVAGVQGPARAV